MPITFNTGVSNTTDASATITFTIPGGVLVNDVMLLSLTCFNEVVVTPTIAFSGGDGGWTLVSVNKGTNPEVAFGGGLFSYGYAYYRIATSGDPGATITITGSGSGFDSTNTWWAAAVASYTTVSTASPIDVAGGKSAYTAGPDVTFSVTSPSLNPTFTTDMAVYLGSGAPGTGSIYSGPPLMTSRESIVSDVGIGAVISDSNGPAGRSIVSGTFTTNWQGAAWLTAFTVGLTAADGGGQGPVFTSYRTG